MKTFAQNLISFTSSLMTVMPFHAFQHQLIDLKMFLYYRFIYWQAMTNVGGSLTMSDSAGSCEPNQTSHTKQADGSGVLTLVMQGIVLSRRILLKFEISCHSLNSMIYLFYMHMHTHV
jgi:hypothetical protein